MKEEQEQEKKSKQTGVLHPVSQCGYIRAIHILSSYITFFFIKCIRVKAGICTKKCVVFFFMHKHAELTGSRFIV